MFGYRHAFHTGNFADVFKHVILVQLLCALRMKDKPFFVLDTHAGAGRYGLASAAAQKVGEYRDGVGRLWKLRGNANEIPLPSGGEGWVRGSVERLSPPVRDYLGLVAAFNPEGRLLSYPGSPRIIQHLLRNGDRLVLCELHPNEFPVLQAEMAGTPQVSVQKLDGYAALRAYLPPKERRGLVFMDPSFEMDGEFERLKDAFRLMQQRWRNGMAAIWYPILHRAPSLRFHAAVRRLKIPKLLCAELGLAPYDSPRGMHGCGMLIVNPPWQLDDTLKRLLPELLDILKTGTQGQTRVEWLA